MKFSEIRLYRAISKAYTTVERPRGSEWLIHLHRELYKLIVDQMTDFSDGVPWNLTHVLEAWDKYGKGSAVENDDSKIDLIVQVAERQADRCFYANRGKGECDDSVHLDRILPEARGGTYVASNCVVSCGRHNCQRGGKSIEDYLASE